MSECVGAAILLYRRLRVPTQPLRCYFILIVHLLLLITHVCGDLLLNYY